MQKTKSKFSDIFFSCNPNQQDHPKLCIVAILLIAICMLIIGGAFDSFLFPTNRQTRTIIIDDRGENLKKAMEGALR
jgi:predicted lactoylglutathione lyase